MNPTDILITGASSGLGLATARVLAERGHRMIMVCLDPNRGAAVRAELAAVATGPEPTLFLGDLASQAAVRSLAGEVTARIPEIDVLINNVGALQSPGTDRRRH